MLHSLKNQASCTDQRSLLIINFLCKTWPKVITGGEYKSEADFDLLIISQLLIDYSFFKIKTDRRYSWVGNSTLRSIRSI